MGRELAIDPATGLEPAIDPVLDLALVLAQVGEPGLAIVQAGVALEHAAVKAELEHVLAVAEPAQGHPPVQPAVALTTKSVTVAHRRDQVRLLAAEDLAAVAAEITREPVATEAAIAWVAAGSVAAVEAADVVVAAVDVAAGGDKKGR
jgi:hypothetical protein